MIVTINVARSCRALFLVYFKPTNFSDLIQKDLGKILVPSEAKLTSLDHFPRMRSPIRCTPIFTSYYMGYSKNPRIRT